MLWNGGGPSFWLTLTLFTFRSDRQGGRNPQRFGKKIAVLAWSLRTQCRLSRLFDHLRPFVWDSANVFLRASILARSSFLIFCDSRRNSRAR